MWENSGPYLRIFTLLLMYDRKGADFFKRTKQNETNCCREAFSVLSTGLWAFQQRKLLCSTLLDQKSQKRFAFHVPLELELFIILFFCVTIDSSGEFWIHCTTKTKNVWSEQFYIKMYLQLSVPFNETSLRSKRLQYFIHVCISKWIICQLKCCSLKTLN